MTAKMCRHKRQLTLCAECAPNAETLKAAGFEMFPTDTHDETGICKPTAVMSDYWTIQAMKRGGGSFVQALGEAARLADHDNLRRIKETWPEYWERYEKRSEQLRRQQEVDPR